MKWARWGLVLAYGTVVALAIVYLEISIHVDPAHSEFSGLPLVLLGLPWSVGIPQLLGVTDASTFIGWAALVGGILVNASILRLLGGILARPSRTSRSC